MPLGKNVHYAFKWIDKKHANRLAFRGAKLIEVTPFKVNGRTGKLVKVKK